MKTNYIKRKEIISLLTQDDYYRKLRKWPLISYDNFQSNNVSKVVVSDDLFTIKSYDFPGNLGNLVKIDKIIEKINMSFPFTNELLIKFQNNLVACGGSICKVITDCYQTSDIDFFFYDLDIYQADKIRIEIIEYMINIWKSEVGKKVSRIEYGNNVIETIIKDVKFYIQRNEYVTTLHIEELCDFQNYPKVYMYQFIHRIYPEISSIIGGFDLSASAVAYNGKDIYATPLGAWSLINKSIIVDMGRRSTSYEYRLKKYVCYGFSIIFPGLTETIIKDKLIKTYQNRSFHWFKEKILDLARDSGYYITQDIDLRDVFLKNDKTIEEPDELAFHKIQKEKDIIPHLILNINIHTKDNEVFIKQSDGNQNDWFDWEEEDIGKCKDDDYYLNKLSDYGYNEKYLMNISDYAHDHMFYKHVPSANATRLRLNNLNGVVSMLYIDDHQNIKEKLINEINNPNLGINDFVIQLYKDKVDKEIARFKFALGNDNHHEQPQLIKCFGLYTSKILNNEYITEYVELMIENLKKNEKICKENLIGIKWITNNPGRQWTSSINPIFKDPREWYGKHYIPVLVGIPPEIESFLRLMRLEKTESVWSILPKDLFDLLLSYILQAYANDAWKYINI